MLHLRKCTDWLRDSAVIQTSCCARLHVCTAAKCIILSERDWLKTRKVADMEGEEVWAIFRYKDVRTRSSETSHQDMLVFIVFQPGRKYSLSLTLIVVMLKSRPVSAPYISGEEVFKSPPPTKKKPWQIYAGVVSKSFFSSAVETPPAALNTKLFISAETYAEDANSLANVVFRNIIRGRD